MSRVVFGRHSDDCAEDGKDVAVAWFSIKPELPYWMDEPFSHEEAQDFLRSFVTLLRERGFITYCTGFSRVFLKGMHLKHPDLPKMLSIIPRETPVLGERRYELVVAIMGADHRERLRTVVMSTDGPDVSMTPEGLLRQLEQRLFLPSVEV